MPQHFLLELVKILNFARELLAGDHRLRHDIYQKERRFDLGGAAT